MPRLTIRAILYEERTEPNLALSLKNKCVIDFFSKYIIIMTRYKDILLIILVFHVN